jgi:hypothetical protein
MAYETKKHNLSGLRDMTEMNTIVCSAMELHEWHVAGFFDELIWVHLCEPTLCNFTARSDSAHYASIPL